MQQQLSMIKKAFELTFNAPCSGLVSAPGRVNLIGEHTDYNGGFVLPCAIDYQTVIAFSPRSDNQVHVVAMDYENAVDQFELKHPIDYSKANLWSNYIRGVAHVMLQKYPSLSGVNMVISGNVPQGAGLSSSAALEVAVGKVMQSVSNISVSNESIALIAQQAENEFVGCQCGIMDQLISACGEKDHALLIDCDDLSTHRISMPENVAVLIVNSNKKRGLVDSEYNVRREQCEAAAAHFNVDLLRAINVEEFERGKAGLDSVTMRRAKHVVYENQRTTDAAKALANSDMQVMGTLMRESHQSMKNDFEITTFEIDFLVDLINDHVGLRGGARMTGGGFGGCVIALVPTLEVDEISQMINEQYQVNTGLKASIYVCHASDGVQVIT